MAMTAFGARVPRRGIATAVTPRRARLVLLVLVGAAVVAGFVADATPAHASADPDLARLLRFMASLKAVMAAGAVAVVLWRLGAPVPALRLAAYGIGCGAMAAGPILVWGLAHVGLGAALLHGGLLATLATLWRDPGVATRLAAASRARHHSP